MALILLIVACAVFISILIILLKGVNEYDGTFDAPEEDIDVEQRNKAQDY